MTTIYKKLDRLETKVYNAFADSYHHGAVPRYVFKELASREVYRPGSKDHTDINKIKLVLAAIDKYKRAFDRLKKADILYCVKRGPKPLYAVAI
jgi:hypothetical protein